MTPDLNRITYISSNYVPARIDFEPSPMRGLLVTFSPAAMEQARTWANIRSIGSRLSGHQDQRRAGQRYTNFHLDMVGIQGEMAIAAYLGLPVRVSAVRDPGHDLTLSTGETFDAKAGFGYRGDLYFAKPCKSDLAGLVGRLYDNEDEANWNRMVFLGWTIAAEQSRKNFICEQENLKAPELLLARHLGRVAA